MKMNLPNKLTLLRVLLIPVFIVFMQVDIENGQTIATIIFIVASVTDWLDGYIARRDNLVTTRKVYGSSCRQITCLFCAHLLS